MGTVPVALPELLALALMATALCLLALDRLALRGDFALAGVFVANGVLPALAGVAGALVVRSDGSAVELSAPEVWLGRLGTVTLLAVAAIAVLRPRRGHTGRALWAGALAYCGAALLTEVFAGDGFPDGTLEIAIGVTALWAAPRLEPQVVAAWAKGVLALFLLGSAAALLLGLPGAAVPYEVGLLPGVAFRVQGITPHANALAPLPVLYLLLEWRFPSPRVVRYLLAGVAGLLLLLAQSKTAWMTALVVAAICVSGGWQDRRARMATATAVLALLAAYTAYSYTGNDQLSSAVEQARTFTGRTQLWRVGLEAWAQDPVWGQGPRFFEAYALRTAQPWTGQAHNQAVEILAERGLIGLAGFSLYVVALARCALRSLAVSGAASLGLVALLLVRSLTETPFTGFDITHLTVFAMLAAWERVPRPGRAADDPIEVRPVSSPLPGRNRRPGGALRTPAGRG